MTGLKAESRKRGSLSVLSDGSDVFLSAQRFCPSVGDGRFMVWGDPEMVRIGQCVPLALLLRCGCGMSVGDLGSEVVRIF